MLGTGRHQIVQFNVIARFLSPGRTGHVVLIAGTLSSPAVIPTGDVATISIPARAAKAISALLKFADEFIDLEFFQTRSIPLFKADLRGGILGI
jgi:hypothetical protein